MNDSSPTSASANASASASASANAIAKAKDSFEETRNFLGQVLEIEAVVLAKLTEDELIMLLSRYSLDSRGPSHVDRSRAPRWSWRAIPKEEHKRMTRKECRARRHQMDRYVNFVAEFTAIPTAVVREMDADTFDVAHQVALERKARLTSPTSVTNDSFIAPMPRRGALKDPPALRKVGSSDLPTRRRVTFCDPVSSVIDDLSNAQVDSVWAGQCPDVSGDHNSSRRRIISSMTRNSSSGSPRSTSMRNRANARGQVQAQITTETGVEHSLRDRRRASH